MTREKANWKTGNRLERTGWDIRKRSAVRLHNSQETPKHLLVKTLVARELQRRDRQWDTEVEGPNGQIDVLDYGEPDEAAVAYEVQTDATPKGKREKVEQYVDGTALRDVIFLDPTDAPDSVPDLVDWVEQEVVG